MPRQPPRMAAPSELRRIRGGAMRHDVVDPSAGSPERQLEVAEEHAVIGRAAAGLVADGDCVLLDSSPAALALARALAERADLRDAVVVTNGLEAAGVLCEAIPRVTVMLTGGTLHGPTRSLGEPLGGLLLERIRAHAAFLGADGIEPGAGGDRA